MFINLVIIDYLLFMYLYIFIIYILFSVRFFVNYSDGFKDDLDGVILVKGFFV